MITATFSNGTIDVYKGTRPVKAAWAIIEKATGEIRMSGHSLDRAKAQKTAEGNVRYFLGVPHVDRPGGRNGRMAQYIAYRNVQARKHGFSDWRAEYADYQAKAEIARRRFTIEIIDL